MHVLFLLYITAKFKNKNTIIISNITYIGFIVHKMCPQIEKQYCYCVCKLVYI